jgi:hypothetical protein
MIAAGAGGNPCRACFVRIGVVAGMLVFGMRIGSMLVLAAVMRVVERVLDMPGRRPARLPQKVRNISRQL